MVSVGEYTIHGWYWGVSSKTLRETMNHSRIVRQMSQAVICGIYHYCDQHRIGTDLSGPSCSEPSYRVLDQS